MLVKLQKQQQQKKPNAYGLFFLHHSSIPSCEDKIFANSRKTESLAGA